nr:transposase [Lactobacillus taiwanensis]
MQIVFGIDVSKSTSTVRELISQSKNEMTITIDRPAFILLLKYLAAFSKQSQIIFEATRVYSRRLQSFLEDYGYSYVVINPLKT